MRLAPYVVLVALACTACRDDSDNSFDIREASVDSVRAALAAGTVTCRGLVELSLERIEALNRRGPALRAVLEVNPDAMALADALDRRYAQSGPVGPLHCVPMLVKDNFNTGDAMTTTAGSLVMEGFRAPTDALAIAKLRAAGALPIAKTHMDEWAQGAAGYGSRGGQMLNAHKLNRIPGGSSGGSAIGIAAGMGTIATGSDTGGSIRIPAALNGVVGIKPTLGLVGRSGIIPSSHQFDVPGPIARTVADAAAMLGVMTGVDPGDAATQASGGRAYADYTTFLDRNGLRGARIGVIVSFIAEPTSGGNAELDAALASAHAAIAAAGATLVQGISVPSVASEQDTIAALITLGVGRFDVELAEYLSQHRHPTLHSLADVVARSRELGDSVVKNLGALENALAASNPTDATWNDAQAMRTRLIAEVNKAMDDAQVDALVFLTLNCPATPLPGVVDQAYQCKDAGPMPFKFGEGYGGAHVLMASLTGFPEITVPAGFTRDGVPIALSFFGRPWSEPALVKYGYAYEQATRLRRAPTYLP